MKYPNQYFPGSVPGFLVLTIFLFASPAVFAEDRVETIDGRQLAGEVVFFDAKSLKIKTKDNKTETVGAGEIARISLGAKPVALKDRLSDVIESAVGDYLPAEKIKMEKEKVSFFNSMTGDVTVPADRLRTIVLPPAGKKAGSILEECRKRKYFHGNHDMLVVKRSDGNLQSVKGVLKSMDAEDITFHFGNRDRKISRAKVPVIFLAKLSSLKKTPGCEISGTDGSLLKVDSVKVDKDSVVVSSPVFGECKLPRSGVLGISFNSDRVVSLIDMEPVEVKEHGFFDMTFKYRKNSSISGGPLKIDGRMYDVGLGMHSHSEITWKLDKQYSDFLATIGIDDAVRPRGNAGVVILADGKEILKKKITGKDDPLDIKVSVRGASKLKIIVDFGEDKLGVSDHVDVVNPRLVK